MEVDSGRQLGVRLLPLACPGVESAKTQMTVRLQLGELDKKAADSGGIDALALLATEPPGEFPITGTRLLQRHELGPKPGEAVLPDPGTSSATPPQPVVRRAPQGAAAPWAARVPTSGEACLPVGGAGVPCPL